ncbi:phage tail protein [uncultured Clostridium sp.]|uniref:phage tail protein n=1 Tax=uncultured Clostridium sp. TaxID=59620 RepID=UPI0028EBF298|nr:phage tail protein [uncultured Clostridium sp.]
MSENFYTMLTIVGKNKLSSSAVSGSKVNFKTLKVGDGKGAYYEPSENQTSLVNKVWEGNISSISIDENNSNWIVVETVIPASDGGFFIREAGIFDEDGDMIAISKLAETYKPVVAEGSTKDLVIRIVLEVLNVDTVTIKIDPNVVAATKNDVQVLEAKVQDVSAQLLDLAKNISNNAVLTQSIDYGMNNVITNNGGTSIQPKFNIQGKTVINLLGKNGNCEDVSKWLVYQVTLALDSTNKVFGNNSTKLTLTSTGGSSNHDLDSIVDKTKYYCLSGYIKNGNATGAILGLRADANYYTAMSTITDNTQFTRVWLKIKPSDFATSNNQILRQVNGSSGQYAYFDGIMLEQITQAQYNDPNFQPSPYVDSYTCLQNPYIEVRHDNLVRNGNGEEGTAWWNLGGTPSSFILDSNRYFVVTDDDTANGENVQQTIPVKPNTAYTFSVILRCGTSLDSRIALVPIDDFGFYSSTTPNRIDVTTTSTIDTIITQTIAIPSWCHKLLIAIGSGKDSTTGGSDTGTVYFKQAMLVEGTTAPTSYKSCSIERVVLETKLTSDDSITYENGTVTGLINWKHRTLYGKDYDWAYDNDFTGFKRVRITAFINNAGNTTVDTMTKYSGDIISNVSACNSLNQFANNITGTYVTIADSDAGWGETIYPNNDEVKAFMNGWRAIYNNGTRYLGWVSIVDGSVPSGAVQSLVSSASSGTTVTVADGTKFAVNDNIAIVTTSGTLRSVFTINSITGNVLTLAGAPGALANETVIKLDNSSTSTSLLTWCKNNVAPNYEGYQLHYKLRNPEPITDDNCHIHGDIPKFDVGDNYLFLDSGGVLGEVANPISTDNQYYRINELFGQNSYYCMLKNKTEDIYNIYKNLIYDNSWSKGVHTATDINGNVCLYELTAKFDTASTYTVDYKILATQAPQIGTINCSYSKDISTAINNLQEEVNSRQVHDSILDEIVDLSLYEKIPTIRLRQRATLDGSSGQARGFIGVNLLLKKAIPIITITTSMMKYADVAGNTYDIPSADISILPYISYEPGHSTRVDIGFTYIGVNSTIKSALVNNGMLIDFSITADCRERI